MLIPQTRHGSSCLQAYSWRSFPRTSPAGSFPALIFARTGSRSADNSWSDGELLPTLGAAMRGPPARLSLFFARICCRPHIGRFALGLHGRSKGGESQRREWFLESWEISLLCAVMRVVCG